MAYWSSRHKNKNSFCFKLIYFSLATPIRQQDYLTDTHWDRYKTWLEYEMTRYPCRDSLLNQSQVTDKRSTGEHQSTTWTMSDNFDLLGIVQNVLIQCRWLGAKAHGQSTNCNVLRPIPPVPYVCLQSYHPPQHTHTDGNVIIKLYKQWDVLVTCDQG